MKASEIKITLYTLLIVEKVRVILCMLKVFPMLKEIPALGKEIIATKLNISLWILVIL